jgi:hypothetical protein
MIELYNINEASTLLKRKKKNRWTLYVLAGLLLAILIPMLIYLREWYYFVVEGVITTIYFWYLLIYLSYKRPSINAAYHFLAEIEQFDHEKKEGTIASLSTKTITVKKMRCFELKMDDGSIYFLEETKFGPWAQEGNKVSLEIVDSFIVAYKEASHE